MGASAEWYRARYQRNKEVVKARTKAYRRRMSSVRWIDELVSTARSRSKKNPDKYGVCDLDDAWTAEARATTACALTGLALVVGAGRINGEAHPLAPSLDRIDPLKGYTKSNVRIVATWVNKARGRMSDELFVALLVQAAQNVRTGLVETGPTAEQMEPEALPASSFSIVRARY
jgi:hypothetical protein